MLAAVVEDFARIDDSRIVTLLHERVGDPLGDECLRVSPEREAETFRAVAARADFTLVIAPETGGVLAERSRWVLAAGGRLLGSTPEAIELTADKLAMSDPTRFPVFPWSPEVRWHEGGAPCTRDLSAIARGPVPPHPGPLPPEFRGERGMDLNRPQVCARPFVPQAERAGDAEVASLTFPLVCKPRDGAGSQATFLVRSRCELESILAQARSELPDAEFLLQPFMAGMAASVAFIIGDGWRMALPPCRQLLSDDGRFHYLGGELPLPDDLAARASMLGAWAVNLVPGLRGYVGVDLVLGDADDGSHDHVIEINPRLTTSYIGLRELARGNLAAAMLAAAMGRTMPDMHWKPGRVRFRAAGKRLEH